MKKFVFAAATAIAMMATAAHAQAIRIGTEGAYEPWNYEDANGNLAGLDIDVMNELCTRAGLECTFVKTAWDTIIPNLNAGNFDVIAAGMSITDERKEAINFTADYSPPDPSGYMMLESSTIDPANLSGAKIGTQTGTIQAAYAEANLAAGNALSTFATAPDALADLMAGNIDVILADSSYIDEAVANSGGALKTSDVTVAIGGGVGAGLRKADTELLAKLDEALAAAKADGTIDALITKHFPERAGPFYQ
ncbi:MAG: transporter substrate-binding domain-containing protein [Devosia sp.]